MLSAEKPLLKCSGTHTRSIPMRNSERPTTKGLPLGFNERAAVLADTLNKESDRGCAILGAEIASTLLEL